jgi:hypothetical protein
MLIKAYIEMGMKLLILMFLMAAVAAFADGPGVIVSARANADFDLTADPGAPQWKGVKGVFAENGQFGQPVPGHRTEVRSRWTNRYLYFLFICPYEELHLKPNPTTSETNQLWNWDVAEVFAGADFQNIRRYREFEMSPQGEWVDLDIDRTRPKPQVGWKWNSGFTVKARLDRQAKIWYGEMKIPVASIDSRPPRPGLEMRINFYRCQGPPSDRKYIAWQPTHSHTFHVPEAFGRLVLGE